MGFLKRAGISIVRPFYRAFFEKPIWWFLAKVKEYFFAETSERLRLIENRLTVLERAEKIEDLFRRAETSNAAQWDALEQLLLALYRQAQISSAQESGKDSNTLGHVPIVNAGDSNQVNEPYTLR